MYEHADQSWRHMPRTMSEDVEQIVASRMAEYLQETELRKAVVIFHGGEPLLVGAPRLASIASTIREAVGASIDVSFSMQTNGILLDEEALGVLESADIGVSLSLDGPRAANDLHRLTIRGRSSFDQSERALELLKKHPRTFAGVISVVDPRTSGRALLEFFDQHHPPSLDFLLPDANHLCPPPGRDADPDLYAHWLIEAFDAWFDDYSHIPLRMFDQLLAVCAGLPSRTDAFGFGDVSLLTIETDGSYHDLDVLKITEDGLTALGGSVRTDPIQTVESSPQIKRHRSLLTIDGLSATCQACPEVDTCGGGSVPHRFGPQGFANPTVYCREMLTLIAHIRRRLAGALPATAADNDPRTSDVLPRGFLEAGPDGCLRTLVDQWQNDVLDSFQRQFEDGQSAPSLRNVNQADLRSALTRPAIVLRTNVAAADEAGRQLWSLSGRQLQPDPNLLDAIASESLAPLGTRVHAPDEWLRLPFGHPIVFEDDPELVARASTRVADARSLITAYSGDVQSEIDQLCRDLVFIRDLEADLEKCVSFSDDVVPGAVYVSVRGDNPDGLISSVDLADSIIHEYRHQKLYLLERTTRLIDPTDELVVSPWRADLRPPSGLLHAVYVFVELLAFWRFLDRAGLTEPWRSEREISTTLQQLAQGFGTLEDVPLTQAGAGLVRGLREQAQL